MKKDKVIIYNHKFFSISQTFVYQQAFGLSREYEVHLLTKEYMNPHGYDTDMFVKHKVSHPVSTPARIFGRVIRNVYNTNLSLNPTSFLTVRKLFKRNDILGMHVHFGDNAYEIFGLVKAFNIPLVITFHGHDASKLLGNKEYAKKLPEIFEYASGIIIVSGHMVETLGLDPWIDKVHLIPCAVNPADFETERTNQKTDSIKILHSGRIVTTKGVPDLIKVFGELSKEYDQIELHVAGDGEEFEKCKELVDKFDIEDKVIFHGFVSQDKVKSLLAETDIFVLNSRTDEDGDMEGTPVSILEAMCMGKAVVSTVHAGIPYVIEHGKNGMLAKEYANRELKNCIEELIQKPELRKKLGRQARQTIEKSHTVDIMQSKINAIFADIANQQR